MKQIHSNSHRSFQYNYNKNNFTVVEFDIIIENGKKVAKNITLTSNSRLYLPSNPQISTNSRDEYGFSEGGVFRTNGDIQQMIFRILKILDETTDI